MQFHEDYLLLLLLGQGGEFWLYSLHERPSYWEEASIPQYIVGQRRAEKCTKKDPSICIAKHNPMPNPRSAACRYLYRTTIAMCSFAIHME